MILENGIQFYQGELAWAEKMLAGLAKFSNKESE